MTEPGGTASAGAEPPRRLLLVNPNTSVHITQRLARSARSQLPSHVRLTALTASSGPAAVQSPTELVAAGERVLAMARTHQGDHDGVIVGISLDCGLAATRAACAPLPVVGMTEAACLMACAVGPRLGLVTLGASMAQSFREHVQGLGLAQRLVDVAAPDAPEAFTAPPDEELPSVLDALTRAAQPLCAAGAASIVLAGAVLCGYAPPLARRLGCPVFDGVASAALLVQAHWRLHG